MQKLTEKDIQYISKLAKLNLDKGDVEKFQIQLTSIIEHIGNLSKVKTENVNPTSQNAGLENIFRKDKIGKSFNQEEALSATDNQKNGYFKIPGILLNRGNK